MTHKLTKRKIAAWTWIACLLAGGLYGLYRVDSMLLIGVVVFVVGFSGTLVALDELTK